MFGQGRGRIENSVWVMVAAVAMLFSYSAPLEGQVTRADSAAVLLEAGANFERDGRRLIAEAIYQMISEQFGGTPAAREAIARLRAPAGERIDPISRIELPVFGTIYGLWLGVAVPAAFGAEDPEAYGAGLLIGGPLGLFTSRAAMKSRVWSEGQARAVSWGGIFGTWQGFGWAEVLDLGEGEFCDSFGCYPTGDNTEANFAGMVVGGLAGIATGGYIARNPVSSGVSSAAQGGSIWGTIYGLMVAGMFDPDGEDAELLTGLLAGNVGLLAGAGLGRKYQLSRPRVRMINLGALVGGLGGLGIDLLVQPDDDATAIAIPLLSSLAGLGIAAHATRNSDRNFSDVEGPLNGAFLSLDEGRWSVDMPLPKPALLPIEDASGRRSWRPGLTIDWFRGRFH